MILNLARHDVLSLYSSPQILEEFARILRGKKFRLSEEQTGVLLKDLMGFTLPGREVPVSVPRLRDPRDHFLCALAAGTKADYLVTGDQDLLVLKSLKKTRIVTARNLLEAEFPELIEALEE